MKPTPQQVNIRSNVNRPKKKKKRVIADESMINVALDSSSNDMVKISELLTCGTKEIQDVLKHECVVIFECKVCRGLFRSIGNFVIHKRKYCVNKFCAINHQDLSSKLQQVEALFKSTSHDTDKGKTKPMRTTQPPTLSSFYESLISKTLSLSPDGKGMPSDILKMQSATVLLDKLDTSNLHQDVRDSSDLSSLLYDASTAILREDGTVVTNLQSLEELYDKRPSSGALYVEPAAQQSNEQTNSSVQESSRVRCSRCRYTCHSRTALHKHLQDVHFTLYKCDQCGKYIHSVRSVLRHLHEVHHFKKETIEQKFKKKVIASKVVKSVPKHLYRKLQSKPQLVETKATRTKSDTLSCCVQCLTVFNSASGAVQCASCLETGPRFPQLPSPAKFLMKQGQGCARSPASSCAGDMARSGSGSPVVFPRHSMEDNRNKAGIQVRMNYDKCGPGDPIISKIETPVDTAEDDSLPVELHTPSLSPSSDSVSLKENANLNGNCLVNGEKENHIISKDKRKNLDSITQKLLNSKIADNSSCPKFSPLCNNKLLNGENGRIRNRKSIRRTDLNFLSGNSVNPTVQRDTEIKSDSENSKKELDKDKVDEVIITGEEPKKRTRQSSVEYKPVILETRRRSHSLNKNETILSKNRQENCVSDKSTPRPVVGKKIDEVIKPDVEHLKSNIVIGAHNNTIEHSNTIEHDTEGVLKRKLRTRTDALTNKKSKCNELMTANVKPCNEKTASEQLIISTDHTKCDIKSVPKSLRQSSESLEDTSASSNTSKELLFKSLMKEIMDVSTDTCRVCKISLPNKKLLRIHAASRHLGYFRFRCLTASCGKMYFSHSDALQHATSSHGSQQGAVARVEAATLSTAAAHELQAHLKSLQT